MTTRSAILGAAAAAMLAVGTAGCANILDTAMDRAGSTIGKKVGDEVGNTVGTAAAGQVQGTLHGLSPALMQLYVQALFTGAFYHGGYWWEDQRYEPGQWTRWKSADMEEAQEFTKGFLKRTKEGQEWWQVAAKSKRGDKEEEVVLEALFEKVDDQGATKLLRLRRQFPDDPEAVEVPVTDENRANWYHHPVKLTKESLEGATKGTEQVVTPAGSFSCKHIQYGDASGTVSWWATKKVPGGLVKVQRNYKYKQAGAEDDEPKKATTQLVAYGDDAKTRLGSF